MPRKLPQLIADAQANQTVNQNRRHLVDYARAEGAVPTVRISGVIDSWFDTYIKFSEADEKLREEGVTEADLVINSNGGSHIEALSIVDLIQASSVNYRSVVIGNAASAAATIAAACPRRVIGKNARFMIHNSSIFAEGNAAVHREVANFLDGCDKDMVAIYSAASGRSEAETRAEMDAETWYQGQAAVDAGYFTELVSMEARAEVDPDLVASFNNAPMEFIEQLQEEAAVTDTDADLTPEEPAQAPEKAADEGEAPEAKDTPETPAEDATATTDAPAAATPDEPAKDTPQASAQDSETTDEPFVPVVSPRAQVTPEQPAKRAVSAAAQARARQLAMFHPNPRN